MLLSSACCDLKNSKVHFGATTTTATARELAAAAVASKLLKGRFVCTGSCKLQAATGAHNEAACVARKPSSQAAKTVRLSDCQTGRQSHSGTAKQIASHVDADADGDGEA